MARVVIVLEDMPNGKVKIISNPEAEEIAQIIKSGNKTTPAQDYALLVRTLLLRITKKMNAKDAANQIVKPW